MSSVDGNFLRLWVERPDFVTERVAALRNYPESVFQNAPERALKLAVIAAREELREKLASKRKFAVRKLDAWFCRIVMRAAGLPDPKLPPEKIPTGYLRHQVDGDPPWARLLRAERKDLVRRAVEGLPGKYREVLMLRFLGENMLSQRDIADMIEISLRTANTRLNKGQDRLRSLLAALAPEGKLGTKRRGRVSRSGRET